VDGPDPGGNLVSNILLYCLDTSVPPPVVRRLKSTADASTSQGNASAYGCTGDVLAENITALTFTYYDANNGLLNAPLDGQGLVLPPGAGVKPDFTTMTNRRAVQSIVVTLVAQESVPGPGQKPQSFTLTSSVRLRNPNN
jgi:hypothetical protein